MTIEQLHYPSANGTDTISARLWLDDGEKPFCILQIVHGMCEHMGRYNDFAEFMAKNGFLVCGNDHLGHGASKGPDGYGYFGKKDGDKNLVEDVRSLNRLIVRRFPELPVVMLGHSMGSFILRSYLTRYRSGLSGVVLSGTAGANPLNGLGIFLCKAIIAFRGGKHVSPMLTKMAFGKYNERYAEKRTKYDWISRDTAVVDRYAADEACTFQFTARAYCDLLRLLDGISGEKWAGLVPKDIPYYFISGTMDPVGGYTDGVKQVAGWLKKAGVKDVTLRFYEGGHHEMLNETNRREVYEDLLNWLGTAIKAPRKEFSGVDA